MNLSELTDLQLDAVREISGIGAGHAATTLSELVERTIRLEVPTIELIDITDVPHVFGGPEQIVGAVYVRLFGELDGAALFMATPEAIGVLLGMLGDTAMSAGDAPDSRRSALLLDAAEKLIASYLSAISDMTGLTVTTSGGALAWDMAGALLEAVVLEVGMRADSAILVRTAFIDVEHTVETAFFFVPDPEGLDAVLGKLGLA
jgi:chemotaxis protein CheC